MPLPAGKKEGGREGGREEGRERDCEDMESIKVEKFKLKKC